MIVNALFIIPQREPREASKLINVAHNYRTKCVKVYILIPKTLDDNDLSEIWLVNKVMIIDCEVATSKLLRLLITQQTICEKQYQRIITQRVQLKL